MITCACILMTFQLFSNEFVGEIASPLLRKNILYYLQAYDI